MNSNLKKLGILLSGRGSNFLAIADSVAAGRIPGAEIAIVISNRTEAEGLAAAKGRGLNALCIPSKEKTREQHDGEVVAAARAILRTLEGVAHQVEQRLPVRPDVVIELTAHTTLYIANLLPSTVLRVAAYRQQIVGRILVTVPPEFYTVRVTDYTGTISLSNSGRGFGTSFICQILVSDHTTVTFCTGSFGLGATTAGTTVLTGGVINMHGQAGSIGR